MDRGGWYRTPSRGGSRWFEVGWGGRRFSDPLTRCFEACCCGGSDGTRLRLRLRLPRCLAMAMRSATAAAVDRTPPAAAPPLYAREEHEQTATSTAHAPSAQPSSIALARRVSCCTLKTCIGKSILIFTSHLTSL